MTEHIKAIPGPDYLTFEMDAAGYDLFRRLIDRAKPLPDDSPRNFNATKDRIDGAFLAGAILMGWRK